VIRVDEDDPDEDLDDSDEDLDEDSGEDDEDDEDDDEDEEEEETWQVAAAISDASDCLCLTSRSELPRLAPIWTSSSNGWTGSAGLASRWLVMFRRRS
jgi:hypothetical protein